MTRVLFLCGKARARSPTAAALAAELPGVDADYAGISTDADEPLSADHIDWADLICVMERRHKKRLSDRFAARLRDKRVICLDIPDRYAFMDDALIARLRPALRRHLPHGADT